MLHAARLWWTLLLAVVLIQLGNGIQSTVVGLRSDSAGLSTWSIAAVMSGMYAGNMVASVMAPRLIARFGHVPFYMVLVFVLAAAPVAFLAPPDVIVWASTRFVFGFALAGIFVVVESWLNDCSTNDTRGMVFAVYIFVQLGGLLVAQFLVPVLAGDIIYALMAVMAFCLLAGVPVWFGNAPRPHRRPYAAASFRALVAASPVGVVGAAVSGIIWAIVMSMSPIYAQRTGEDASGIAVFVASAVLGGILLQLPVGWWSDRMDRRIVLAIMGFGSALAALVGATVGGDVAGVMAMFAYGALTFPLYTVAVSHVNDRVEPEQRVAASGAMILLFGAGSILGPVVTSVAMDAAGPVGFFLVLAIVSLAFGGFTLGRILATPRSTLQQPAQTDPAPE
jgi:MFS family permease